ncbi:MAG: HlyD family efflux transporter periplasmic adaptor subunit [Verrucomicrobiota bacterium]
MSARLIFSLLIGFIFADAAVSAEDPPKAKTPEVKETPNPAPKKSEATDTAKPAAKKPKAVPKKPKAAPKEMAKDIPEAEEKSEKPAPEKDSETVKVEKGSIEITAEIPGVLRSRKSTPMKMELVRWADLLVVEALPHGTEVKKGDVLVELETKGLKKKIEELEIGMPLKQLDLEASKLSFENLQKTTPIALDKARDAKMRAEEDFVYFEDVTRPMRERNAKEDVKQIKAYLAYAEEELNQLKKMYEADDLTEETEEIILRRAQNSVNDYRWRLEQTEERSRRNLTTLIPREHEGLQRSLEETRLSWRTQEKSLPDALKKAELEFQAKVRSMEEAETSHAEFLEDLEAMTIRAPHDGVVYYGMTQRGKWTTASTVERKLIPGGKLTMREIFMTVVDPKNQELLLTVPENKLSDLEEGQTATISLTSDPDTEITGKLVSISHVPYADNTFSAVLAMNKAPKEAVFFPGMKAKAEIAIYEKEDALLIPSRLVKEEKGDSFVTLANGDKRRIETGRTSGAKIEVLKGLKEGDELQAAKSGESEEKPESGDSKEEEK